MKEPVESMFRHALPGNVRLRLRAACKFAAVFVLATFSLFAISCSAGEDVEQKADGAPCRIGLDIECEQNFAFSKYDVEVFVDDESIGIVEHGTSRAFELELGRGDHFLRICENGNANVNGSLDFRVEDDGLIDCAVRCKDGEVRMKGAIADSSIDLLGTSEESSLLDTLADVYSFDTIDDDEDFSNCRVGEWAARKNFENYGEALYQDGFDCLWRTDLVMCEPQDDGSYRIEVGVSVTDDDGFSDRTYAGGIIKDGVVSDFWVR